MFPDEGGWAFCFIGQLGEKGSSPVWGFTHPLEELLRILLELLQQTQQHSSPLLEILRITNVSILQERTTTSLRTLDLELQQGLTTVFGKNALKNFYYNHETQQMKDRSTSAAIYASSLLALFSVNEWCMIFGAALSALAFIYNIYYKERMLKMLKEKQEITIKED